MEEAINLVLLFNCRLLMELSVALRKPGGFCMTDGQTQAFIKKKKLNSPKLAQTTVNFSQRLP